MRTKYKPWAAPYLLEHKEIGITLEEIGNLEYPVYLEIGAGKGQFLLDMAKKFPDINFIGVEKNISCAGFSAKKLVEEEIINAKLYAGDGEEVVKSLKDNTVKCLFLNFSDPWPKKKHNKRRLTHDTFLKEYHRVLNDEGVIIFKTDNVDLFNFSIEKLIEFNFEIISVTNDYDVIDEFDTPTEYEMNFRNKGIKINRLIAKRK